MGVVYQAVHERLHREVAIKFVPVATVKDLLDVDRLQREMTAVRQIAAVGEVPRQGHRRLRIAGLIDQRDQISLLTGLRMCLRDRGNVARVPLRLLKGTS